MKQLNVTAKLTVTVKCTLLALPAYMVWTALTTLADIVG